MKIIQNKSGDIVLPWEPGLLEWLQQQYPFSKYHTVEISKE